MSINCAKTSALVPKDALSGLRQFLRIESPLKMLKNVFCFILKALAMQKNGLIRKTGLIFKFMTSQPG